MFTTRVTTCVMTRGVGLIVGVALGPGRVGNPVRELVGVGVGEVVAGIWVRLAVIVALASIVGDAGTAAATFGLLRK